MGPGAKSGGRRTALFFTGRKHAGENLADVLKGRDKELPVPIQMCDALSRNTSGDFKTIVANCLAHSRRKYVEVADEFPEECHYVIETLAAIYHNDTLARERKMSPPERLAFHQAESGQLMKGLKEWLDAQFQEHNVEPNSALGNAIKYMRKHWEKLTLFLRVPGAPLDNTAVERALKKAILHRKNSLFYKTLNGARVGDLFMSFIFTAELVEANPFHYLVSLLRNKDKIAAQPERWMPWNYHDALEESGAVPP